MSHGEPNDPSRYETHRIASTKGSAAIALAVGLAVVGLFLIGFAAINGSGLFILFATLFSVAAVLGVGYVTRELGKWEPLTLDIPEWPLPIGSDVIAELHKTAKSEVADRTVPIAGALICTEKVTYRAGTDTRTAKETVCNLAFSAIGQILDGVFRAQIPLQIPLDRGAPTMDFEHNEIAWRVELDLAGFSQFAANQSFDILVGPRLASGPGGFDGQAGPIQDSPRPS